MIKPILSAPDRNTRTVRGAILATAILLIMIMLMAGCGDGGGASTSTSVPSTSASDTPGTTQFAQAALASSELIVGEDRFVLGLLDQKSGQPINTVPDVTVQFFKVNDDGTATKTGDATPIFRNENLPAGVYVTRNTFDRPGKWGAIVTIKPKDGQEPYSQKMEFDVVTHGSVPVPGDKAPLSHNQTIHSPDVYGIGEICSAQPPDDMHEMTIADAVTSGKPTVILFAAPGFCPSFTCGPDLQLVQRLEAKYKDKANFLHIESPNSIQTHTHTGPAGPAHHQLPGHLGVDKPQVQTAEEWGLKTEPWIFFVDKDGKIVDRFEGGLTYDEVEPRLAKMLNP